MIRNYRSFLPLIVVGLAIFVVGTGEFASVWADRPTAYPAYLETTEEAGQGLAVSPNSKAIKAPKYQQPCRNREGRNASELCADWRATDAAERSARWAWWQMYFSGFGVLGLIITIGYNTQSLRLSRKAIALDHLPRLLVTNIAIWSETSAAKKPPTLAPGEKIRGYAWVSNAGRDTAHIKESLLIFHWGTEPLPMIRPYDPPNIYEPFRLNLGDAPKIIPRGAKTGWDPIRFTIPAAASRKHFLFVMGWIEYAGSEGANRWLSFCRRYDPDKQIFLPVENQPNYESEE